MRPRALKSTIAKRAFTSRHSPSAATPWLSGPRWRIAAAMSSAAGTKRSAEDAVTRPAIPHINAIGLQKTSATLKSGPTQIQLGQSEPGATRGGRKLRHFESSHSSDSTLRLDETIHPPTQTKDGELLPMLASGRRKSGRDVLTLYTTHAWQKTSFGAVERRRGCGGGVTPSRTSIRLVGFGGEFAIRSIPIDRWKCDSPKARRG